jgi:hypothetical protein
MKSKTLIPSPQPSPGARGRRDDARDDAGPIARGTGPDGPGTEEIS